MNYGRFGKFLVLCALPFVLVGFFALVGFPQQSYAQFADVVTVKAALKEALQANGAKSLVKREVVPTAEQAAEMAKLYGIEAGKKYTMYTGLTAEKKPVGTVVIVDVAGYEGPLQMIICIEPDSASVYDLGFTMFAEERGKPAKEAGYLKQYIGADVSWKYALGKDVDGITGATGTSTAVAAAVKIGTSVYDYFVTRGNGVVEP